MSTDSLSSTDPGNPLGLFDKKREVELGLRNQPSKTERRDEDMEVYIGNERLRLADLLSR